MSGNWHTFIPGPEFTSSDLFANICETLIDEGTLIIVRNKENDRMFYRWKIKSTRNKIIINGIPGQLLRISMEEKNDSKIESVA